MFLKQSKPFQNTHQCLFYRKKISHCLSFHPSNTQKPSFFHLQEVFPIGIPLFSLSTAQQLHKRINQGCFYGSPKCIHLNLSWVALCSFPQLLLFTSGIPLCRSPHKIPESSLQGRRILVINPTVFSTKLCASALLSNTYCKYFSNLNVSIRV